MQRQPYYDPGYAKSNMNNTKNSIATNPNQSSNKMFDLKMCLLDFMRISTNGARHKKSSKELPNNPSSQLHHKFKDTSMIYFNENMSMTSRSNTIRFSRCPTGNFKPNAVSNLTRQRQRQPVYEWIGGKGSSQLLTSPPILEPVASFTLNVNDKRKLSSIDRCSPDVFDSSSDERIISTTDKSVSSLTESPVSDSSLRETETDDFSDSSRTLADANSVAGLDSFCTLCTSSFSYNRCNQCEESSCGSKCNLSQSHDGKSLLDRSGNISGGGECSSISGMISSDCDSILFRYVLCITLLFKV